MKAFLSWRWVTLMAVLVIVIASLVYVATTSVTPTEETTNTNTSSSSSVANTNSNSNTAQPTETEDDSAASLPSLFLAKEISKQDSGSNFSIGIFDVSIQQLTQSFDLTVPDQITDNSAYNAVYSNEGVQYDPSTQTGYLLTDGVSAMGGECINADTTCDSKIYTFQLSQQAPRVLYQTEHQVMQWMLDTTDHSLFLVSHLANRSGIRLEKVNAETGRLVFTQEYAYAGEYGDYYELTSDESAGELYQIEVTQAGEALERRVILHRFSVANGTHTTQELYGASAEGASQVVLSPNTQFVAAYHGMSFYLFDLNAKKFVYEPVSLNVKNYNLFWSADSTQVMLNLQEGLFFYDVNTGERTAVPAALKSDYPYHWAPSDDYIVYSAAPAPQHQIALFDLTQEKSITPLDSVFSGSGTVLGMRWIEE